MPVAIRRRSRRHRNGCRYFESATLIKAAKSAWFSARSSAWSRMRPRCARISLISLSLELGSELFADVIGVVPAVADRCAEVDANNCFLVAFKGLERSRWKIVWRVDAWI